jgi:hypothetical protein
MRLSEVGKRQSVLDELLPGGRSDGSAHKRNDHVAGYGSVEQITICHLKGLKTVVRPERKAGIRKRGRRDRTDGG